LAEQIHVICDAFDVAWGDVALGNGQQPQIEDYLADTDASNRSPIFHELLLVELEYRRKLGETPESSEYATRFPKDAETIAQAFISAADQDTANISLNPEADTAVRAFGPQVIEPAPTLVVGSQSAAGSLLGQFGDYELLKEIARGGMGIVCAGQRADRG
jgi:serine/threonine-protein kinase